MVDDAFISLFLNLFPFNKLCSYIIAYYLLCIYFNSFFIYFTFFIIKSKNVSINHGILLNILFNIYFNLNFKHLIYFIL